MENHDIKLLRDEMKNEFQKLNENILLLTKSINELTKSTSRMDNHINFVEESYETLRSPLDFIVKQVNGLCGIQKTVLLPQIQLDSILNNALNNV